MIEVFKTNVTDPCDAARLIVEITKIFSYYSVNFDLEDCDRIMRVKSPNMTIDSENIIALLNNHGFYAGILEDEIGMIS